MNTDTGRIYDPEQYERLRRAADPEQVEALRAELREFAAQELRDFRAGKVVPVSEHVANLMREGKASAEARGMLSPLAAYADSCEAENPCLADDLRRALAEAH